MITMIHWREAALQYPCETCGVAPDVDCISVGGLNKYEIHEYRSQKASENNWELVERSPMPDIKSFGPHNREHRQTNKKRVVSENYEAWCEICDEEKIDSDTDVVRRWAINHVTTYQSHEVKIMHTVVRIYRFGDR